MSRKKSAKGRSQVVVRTRRPSAVLAPARRFDEVLALIDTARRRAYRAVNSELVSLYWQLGEYISKKIASAEWGDGVVDELAVTIARRYPGMHGYTRRNLFRMRQFFETYRGDKKVSPLVTQLPWTHHLIILGQAKPPETREFYMLAAIKERWSKRELERQILTGAALRSAGAKKVSPVVTQTHPTAIDEFKNAYSLEFLAAGTGAPCSRRSGTLCAHAARLRCVHRAVSVSGPPDRVPTAEELRRGSQYFRLELELAARAGRPALVFSDERFRGVLSCPETIRQVTYDPLELSSGSESSDYFASGNCEHELEAMVARRDERRLDLLPVKLAPGDPDGQKLELPPYLANIHYLRYWNYPTATEAVAAIVTAFDKARSAGDGAIGASRSVDERRETTMIAVRGCSQGTRDRMDGRAGYPAHPC